MKAGQGWHVIPLNVTSCPVLPAAHLLSVTGSSVVGRGSETGLLCCRGDKCRAGWTCAIWSLETCVHRGLGREGITWEAERGRDEKKKTCFSGLSQMSRLGQLICVLCFFSPRSLSLYLFCMLKLLQCHLVVTSFLSYLPLVMSLSLRLSWSLSLSWSVFFCLSGCVECV